MGIWETEFLFVYSRINELKNKSKMKKLTFEEWYDLNESEIWIELAEIGADREMDFNPEYEFEIRYEDYCNSIDE